MLSTLEVEELLPNGEADGGKGGVGGATPTSEQLAAALLGVIDGQLGAARDARLQLYAGRTSLNLASGKREVASYGVRPLKEQRAAGGHGGAVPRRPKGKKGRPRRKHKGRKLKAGSAR